MKRIGLALSACLAAAVAGFALPRRGGEEASPARVEIRPTRATEAASAAPHAVARAWGVRVAPVTADCGLDLASACDGQRCVSLLEVPPLDGPGGWVRLATTSPTLVASVVAGELGLPDRSTACRAAIRDLDDQRILARAQDGGELWCLTDGSPGGRSLCDQAARTVTGAAVDFASGEDRVVVLR